MAISRSELALVGNAYLTSIKLAMRSKYARLAAVDSHTEMETFPIQARLQFAIAGNSLSIRPFGDGAQSSQMLTKIDAPVCIKDRETMICLA